MNTEKELKADQLKWVIDMLANLKELALDEPATPFAKGMAAAYEIALATIETAVEA